MAAHCVLPQSQCPELSAQMSVGCAAVRISSGVERSTIHLPNAITPPTCCGALGRYDGARLVKSSYGRPIPDLMSAMSEMDRFNIVTAIFC